MAKSATASPRSVRADGRPIDARAGRVRITAAENSTGRGRFHVRRCGGERLVQLPGAVLFGAANFDAIHDSEPMMMPESPGMGRSNRFITLGRGVA